MSDNPGGMAAPQEADVDMLQADAVERKEIEGEWLTEIRSKGYPLTWHNEREPCFSCTLTRLLAVLPEAAGQTKPDRAESLDQNEPPGGSP